MIEKNLLFRGIFSALLQLNSRKISQPATVPGATRGAGQSPGSGGTRSTRTLSPVSHVRSSCPPGRSRRRTDPCQHAGASVPAPARTPIKIFQFHQKVLFPFLTSILPYDSIGFAICSPNGLGLLFGNTTVFKIAYKFRTLLFQFSQAETRICRIKL
jgi:hypothetical protein